MKAWYSNKVLIGNVWHLLLYDVDVKKGQFGPKTAISFRQNTTIKRKYLDVPANTYSKSHKIISGAALVWHDISKLKKHIINDLITADEPVALAWVKR